MADNVFPEDQGTGGYPDTDVSRGSDFNDAAHFAAHAYAGRPYSALIDGGQISYPDTTTTDISISNGMAAIVASNVTGDQSDYTHDSGTFIVDFDSRVVTLNSGVSEIYLTIDLDNNDSVAIDARTDGTTPSLPSLKIGVVDTADATVRDQWYLLRDDGTLSFPDSAAVGTALNTLDTLSTVYNRSAGKRVIDSALSIDDLDTTALTDQITDTQLDTSSGFFDLGSNDLRLATGQSIEDGNSKQRLFMGSNNTSLHDEEGTYRVNLDANSQLELRPGAGMPFKIYDVNGSFDAIKYKTSASKPGTLELTNASLEAPNGVEVGQGSKLNFRDSADNFFGQIEMNESSSALEILASGNKKLSLQGDIIDMSLDAANLRLDTGQAIEDGSGTERVSFEAGGTLLKDESGSRAFSAVGGVRTQIDARSGQPILFRDREGGFNAVEYNTDPTTGTLVLRNAKLQLRGNEIRYTADNGKKYNEETVSTNDTQILRTDYGQGLIVVSGRNGSDRFTDLITITRQSFTVIQSEELSGPANRNYSAGGNNLDLAMSSGTYDVNVQFIHQLPDP